VNLLDTDVLIDVQRRHPPALAWFGSLPEPPSVPGFVVFTLRGTLIRVISARDMSRKERKVYGSQ
jgi:predicted nucleic acid-binding protein